MRHLFIFFALFLFGTTYVAAAPHLVAVYSEGKEADAVVTAIKARLNGTERFQTTESDYAELTISVLCFDMEKYNVTGAVCSYEFEYDPPSASTLPTSLHEGVGMIMGMGRGEIGEMIFDSFVKASTEEMLQSASRKVQTGVMVFCSHPENAQFCNLIQPPSK